MGAANHCWGRQMSAGGSEKSQQFHKYFLQYSKFPSKRPQVRTWGRQTCYLPRAPPNLVTPLPSLTREFYPKVLERIDLLQCIATYSMCSLHWFSFLETNNISVFLVLIFIGRTQLKTGQVHVGDPVQRMHAVPNCSQKTNGWSSSFQRPLRLGCDNLCNSCRIQRGVVAWQHTPLSEFKPRGIVVI